MSTLSGSTFCKLSIIFFGVIMRIIGGAMKGYEYKTIHSIYKQINHHKTDGNIAHKMATESLGTECRDFSDIIVD